MHGKIGGLISDLDPRILLRAASNVDHLARLFLILAHDYRFVDHHGRPLPIHRGALVDVARLYRVGVVPVRAMASVAVLVLDDQLLELMSLLLKVAH